MKRKTLRVTHPSASSFILHPRMTGLFLYTRAREHCLQIVVAVAAVGKWETRAVERGRFPLFHQPIR